MKLKCRINGVDYDISQGTPISEEYNETLDSATVIIPKVQGKIKDLQPYDDVYIYEGEFLGHPVGESFNANIEIENLGTQNTNSGLVRKFRFKKLRSDLTKFYSPYQWGLYIHNVDEQGNQIEHISLSFSLEHTTSGFRLTRTGNYPNLIFINEDVDFMYFDINIDLMQTYYNTVNENSVFLWLASGEFKAKQVIRDNYYKHFY